MLNRDEKSVLEVNVFFLFLCIVLLIVSTYFKYKNPLTAVLLIQYLIILLPTLIYLKIKKRNIKNTLKINRLGLLNIIKIIILSFLIYPIIVFFQAVFIGFINHFYEIQAPFMPIAKNFKEYILSLLIMGLTPGICEEVLFRGLIMNEYRFVGIKKSIIISGTLFGILHFNLLNLIGPMILGIVFGITVYKTNSIFAGILGHTCNNFIALTLTYFFNNKSYLMNSNFLKSNYEIGHFLKVILIILTLNFFLSYIIIFSLKEYNNKGIKLNVNYDGIYYKGADYSKNSIKIYSGKTKYENIKESNKSIILDYSPIFVTIILYLYFNYMYILN